MKVFASSLISGMEAEREAVKQALRVLGHEPVMAEDFGARPNSPQVACLAGLRDSDLVVLVLGPRYGAKQASGLSATHEEYREARGTKPVLVFIREGEAEAEQAAFIDEVSSWESGLFRPSFSSPEQLRDLVTRALHDYAIAHARPPLDPDALVARALALLPDSNRRRSTNATLQLAVAAGPESAVLRPAELESRDLREAMEQSALFGNTALFERRVGTESRLQSGTIAVFQDGAYGDRSEVRFWSTGDVRFTLPLREDARGGTGLPVVIEETVASRLAAAIRYAAWLLGRVDPTERITHVALAAALPGEAALGWRTQSEHAANPNSGSFAGFGREQERGAPVTLSPPHRVRAALTMDADRMVEDLVVLLRQRWKEQGGQTW